MLFVSPAKQSGTQGSCNLVSNIFFKNVGNFKAPSKIKHGIEYLKKFIHGKSIHLTQYNFQIINFKKWKVLFYPYQLHIEVFVC